MIEKIFTLYVVVIILCVVIYIPKLAQLFSAFWRPARKQAKEKRKISLVIPARNESLVIGDLFHSIQKQTYDREYFEVNVIVKSADDPTVAMAEKIGAKVYVVPEQTCKGEALDGFFKSEHTDCDAYVIIDADAVLTENYVEELNNALEYDRQIFLSRKDIKNYLYNDKKKRSVYVNCSALTYPQLDDLSNNYRTKHSIPMNMCGQGMMVRKEVIDEIGGWPYRSLTEDYELRMDCFLKGFTSMYYPYARLYTEETLTHKQSYERRLRWVTGFSQCDRMYKKRIMQNAKKRGEFTEGEFEYFYSLVPLIVFIVATVLTAFVGVGVCVFFALQRSILWLRSLLMLTLCPIALMYVLLFGYAGLCMLAYRDVFAKISVWERIVTLFYAPLFIVEYFPIFMRSRVLAKQNYKWKLTEHIVYDE